MFKKNWLTLGVLLVVGIFYFSTIRAGHYWNGDFSMYIMHARNIAEGRNYCDTCYVYDPLNPFIGPKAYPPVYPLLIAPLYKFFGPDMTAFKVENIIFMLLFFAVVYFLFRDYLGAWQAAALTAVLGFNPNLWAFKDWIYADAAFLAFIFSALLLIDKIQETEFREHNTYLLPVIAGILTYLSFGTRPVGLIIIPCFLLSDLLRFKKITKPVLAVAAIGTLGACLQTLLISNVSEYGTMAANIRSMGGYPGSLLAVTGFMARSIYEFWSFDVDRGALLKFLRLVFVLLFTGLSVGGFIMRCRKKITVLEIFPVLYVGGIIAAGFFDGIRFIFPVLPFYLFYAFYALRQGFSAGKAKILKPLIILISLWIAAYYCASYARTNFGPLREGVHTPESVALFDYVRQNTGDSDVIVFRKPRIMCFFTGRKSAAYHQADDAGLWTYFREINASYLIIGRMFDDDVNFLIPFEERNKTNLSEVFSNPDFKVYRIAPPRLAATEPTEIDGKVTEKTKP